MEFDINLEKGLWTSHVTEAEPLAAALIHRSTDENGVLGDLTMHLIYVV